MRAAIDADFNADSRALSVKLEIYFHGPTAPPLTITKDDYLIDATWLEESAADSSNPFGAVSSNEFSFRLFNKEGIFSPTNAYGPYFNLIKTGVLIIPYIKPEDLEEEVAWEKLGEYFVTDWAAAITGAFADVIANDIWQQIFNSPAPPYLIEPDVPFYIAMQNIYNLMGYAVEVSPVLNEMLTYSFIAGDPLNFTQEIATGALSFCTSNKAGKPIIAPYISTRPVRALLTDDTQIKVASVVPQSTAYDGVELTYSMPQIIEQEQLIDISDFEAPSGLFQLQNISFNTGPVWQVAYIGLQSTSAKVVNFVASPWNISLSINNSGSVGALTISAYGKIIGFTNITLTDNAANPIKVSSRYIQGYAYAQYYRNVLANVIADTVPVLTLSIRGNPLLAIGDIVQVQSLKYNLNYTGFIKRMVYRYDGSLSCEITLLNEAFLQV